PLSSDEEVIELLPEVGETDLEQLEEELTFRYVVEILPFASVFGCGFDLVTVCRLRATSQLEDAISRGVLLIRTEVAADRPEVAPSGSLVTARAHLSSAIRSPRKLDVPPQSKAGQ